MPRAQVERESVEQIPLRHGDRLQGAHDRLVPLRAVRVPVAQRARDLGDRRLLVEQDEHTRLLSGRQLAELRLEPRAQVAGKGEGRNGEKEDRQNPLQSAMRHG